MRAVDPSNGVAGDSSAGAGGIVFRKRLLARLEHASRVTAVSAPAGSGKTVLVDSWIAAAGLADRAARVSVERDEREPKRFWLAVLNSVRATTDGSVLVREMTTARDLDAWTIVERLLNDLGSLEDPLWLVIDNVHELASSEAQRQLEVFLMRAPETLRFVLITRRDLRLGLHRLRLTRGLTEIRGHDLRLTSDEARELMEGAGVELSHQALTELLGRTEGWAAGLTLAASSLVGHPDPDRAAVEFSGTERTVVEYLLAETLERQPEHVRSLLLRTAMLERVCGSLADVLTGQPGSELILQELDRANEFVVSLDTHRSWFRYHRLFADFLKLELLRTAPGELPGLHATAAEWLAEYGDPLEAIRHAQAAGDWSLATRILSDHWLELTTSGNELPVRELLEGFPRRVRAEKAELKALAAADELTLGSLEEAERHLALAARELPSLPADRRGPCGAMLSVLDLSLARQSVDVPAVVEKAERLLDPAGAANPAQHGSGGELRALATISVGITQLWGALPDEADRQLEQGIAAARRSGRASLEAAALAHSGLAASLRSLRPALERSAQAIELTRGDVLSDPPTIAVADLVLGLTRLWQGRLEEVEPKLVRAERALHAEVEPAAGSLLHAIRGLAGLAHGHNDEALRAFRTAERLGDRLVAKHTFSRAMRARLVHTLVRLGDARGVERAIAETGEEERQTGELHIARAILHIDRNDPQAATVWLASVLDGSIELLVPHVWMVEAFLLEGIARDLLGDSGAAQRSVERALDLAEPDGILLPFLLHRTPTLLQRVSRHRTTHASLVAEIVDLQAGRERAHQVIDRQQLSETLTATETRVLRYLPTHLSLRDIGSELYLSVNTIKVHIRNIYAKLEVHSRREAIERARALGLLGPSSRNR